VFGYIVPAPASANGVGEVMISPHASRFITPKATQMRARISWCDPANLLSVIWRVSIDQTVWTIVP